MWIGLDALHTDELDRLLARPWFRAYTYAPEELALADSFGPERAREFLAGRFAGKEAVLKVLRPGAGGRIPPRQVAIVRTGGGAPLVRLSGAAARRAAELELAEVSLSISHKGDFVVAAAMALAEGVEPDLTPP
ncbi:holo-ACP synthase [Streptomyces sp. NPDC057743]|uniref:holo-ACP synthase n=1 Tax=Streptomyces sp. NPDC057743 TaxID=3346236 RepID=UPI00368B3ADA